MSNPVLTEIREIVLNKLGLNFLEKQEKELYAKIGAASKGFNFNNTDEFINWLINQPLTPAQIEKLATYLTIGETYFFREKKALDFLEFKYLPDLIGKRKGKGQHLKIWSAGCASGEEPYSVAILLKHVIPDIENWDITILATDINAAFLEKARAGVYSKWSFRGIPESFKTNNFEKIENEKFRINGAIKEMVTFSYLNLASGPYPSINNIYNTFDVILCRNVLIYFSHKGIKTVTSKLYSSLADEGVLLVSPVETSDLISPKFNRLSYKGVTIYMKDPKNTSTIKSTPVKSTTIKYPQKQIHSITSKPTIRHFEKPPPKPLKTLDVKIPPLPIPKVPNKIPDKKKAIERSDYQKVLALYKAGLYNEVEKSVNKAIKNNNQDCKSSILLLARVKANKGQLDESEKLCLHAINIDKVDAKAHYLLATVQSEQGKINEAIKSLNNTLFLEPDFALGHFLLGNILSNNGGGGLNKSKQHYRNALKSLAKLKHDDILAESDGLTAGRLTHIINSLDK